MNARRWIGAGCLALAALAIWLLVRTGGEPRPGDPEAAPDAAHPADTGKPPDPPPATAPRIRSAQESPPAAVPRRIRLVNEDDTAVAEAFEGVLDAAPPDRPDLQVRSDADGRFDVPDAAPSVLYELRADAPGSGRSVRARVSFGKDQEEVAVRVPRSASVRVAVNSTSGTPVAGARVYVVATVAGAERVAQAVAGTDGSASLALDPAASDVRVGACAPGFEAATGIVEMPAAGRFRATVVLPPGVGVTGVVRAADGSPVRGALVRIAALRRQVGTAGSAPVAADWLSTARGLGGAQSGAYKDMEHDEFVVATVRTDDAGRFAEPSPVLPADRIVIVVGASPVPAWRVVEGPHRASGETIDVGTITLAGDQSIRIRLVDAEGNPVADAAVSLLPAGLPQGLIDIPCGRTDAAGWAQAPAVLAGREYRVTAAPATAAADGTRFPWIAEAARLDDGATVRVARFDPRAGR
jgi:hypothetical protein